MGSIRTSVHPELPWNYVDLAQLVLSIPSASSLYNNPIWLSSTITTLGLFIKNTTSQPIVHYSVTSIPVQSTILNPLVSSVQVTHPIQLMVSRHVSVSSSIPLGTGQAVPSPGGKSPSVSMMFGTTNVSGSKTHMVGMNQPSSGAIPNPASPAGLSNVEYQQKNLVDPSGSSNIQYHQPNVAQIQYQPPYVPYG